MTPTAPATLPRALRRPSWPRALTRLLDTLALLVMAGVIAAGYGADYREMEEGE